MLQSLSEQIRLCYERAAEAMRRAEETTDPETKADFLNTERRWLLLARSYQFSDSLKDFIRAIPDRLFGTGSTLKDATVRHRDRQALRNPEEDLQTVIDGSAYLVSIVNSSSDAILSKNLNGVILSWNRGAELIFGYSADEVVGKSITILMPSDLLDEEPKILERIRRGEHIDNYETKRRHKDGRLLDILLTVSPVKDADGRIVGASKIARDITYQKRAQQRMAADLWAMTTLREVGSLCAREGKNLDKCLHGILYAAIAIAGADKGNIQLLEPEAGVLTIAAQRGFGPAFLKYFECMRDGPSACSAAMHG